MKQKSYILLVLAALWLMLALSSCTVGNGDDTVTPVKLIKVNVDDAGLISCKYVKSSGDTFALDYLTLKGFKALLDGDIKGVYPKSNHEGYVKVRARSLENRNFISVVYMDKTDVRLYQNNDTVWVNLDTHRIDDTCRTAMAYTLEMYKP